MSKKFLQKLHALCDEWAAHRNRIMEDYRQRELQDIYVCLDCLHDILHKSQIEEEYPIEDVSTQESYRVGEIPAKIDHISSTLSEMRHSLAMISETVQETKRGVDDSFR